MSLLTICKVSKGYGTQEVLSAISLTIGPSEKVALVGHNGSGKSTLLRLIAGEEETDSGRISVLPGTSVGYLAQEPDLSAGATLLDAVTAAVPRIAVLQEYLNSLSHQLETHPPNTAQLSAQYAEAQQEFAQLGGPAYPGRVKATLVGLGFRETDFDLPVSALSGGQRTRAALAKLLLQEPDLLLLDEPTNHLDLPAIEWLEEYLTRTRSAVLVVSHDRYFLDRIVTRVIELENGQASSYPGNYTAYSRLREERLRRLQAEYERKLHQVEKLQEYIRRYGAGNRASMAKSREKWLARIELHQPRARRPEVRLDLTPGLRSGDEVLCLEGLSKSYGTKPLFSGLSLVVRRGDRVGIVGPNGSGKTTLLRILVGQVRPDSGRFTFGHNVEPAYFAQDFAGLCPENTLLEEIMEAGAPTIEEARALLARFLFFGDDVFKRVGELSGGETNRVALARLLLSRANLLLLDEPTNHLDIAARDHLEEALLAFSGTILCASHDRYLLDRIATRIVEIAGGQGRVFDDTYAAFRRRQEREHLLAAQAAERAAKKAPSPSPPPRKSIRPAELRRALKQAEERIAATESRLKELAEALATGQTYTNADQVRDLNREYAELNASLAALYAEWEQLAEAVEALAVRP